MTKETGEFTYHYSQPKEYRFSLDSVFLAKEVAKTIPQDIDPSQFKVLDLCAGCGVIGMELHYHRPDIEQMTFVEIQKLYFDHFLKNKEMVQKAFPHSKLQFEYIEKNYEELLLTDNMKNKFDIVVCNPPYFLKGEGLLSPNEFKNRCRFFLDSDFRSLFLAIIHVLKPNAKAYVLIRDGSTHGRNPLEEVKNILASVGKVDFFKEVRGTLVLQITKTEKA